MIAIYEDRKGFSFILDCMKELKSRKLSFKLFFFGDYSLKDILEIKESYLKGLTFHYVNEMKEVIDIALTKQKVKNAKKLL